MSRPPSMRHSQNAARSSPRAQPHIQKPLDESNRLCVCDPFPGRFVLRKCPTLGVRKDGVDPPLPSNCCAVEIPPTVHTHNQNEMNKIASVFLAAGIEIRRVPSCCETVERVGYGEITGGIGGEENVLPLVFTSQVGIKCKVNLCNGLTYTVHLHQGGEIVKGGHSATAGWVDSLRVLAQPEMEKRRSPLVSIPPFGRGFSRHGGLSIRWKLGGARTSPHAPFIVSMSPPGYPSAWLRPRSARFRFARQDHCSSGNDLRFSTPGWPIIAHEFEKW